MPPLPQSTSRVGVVRRAAVPALPGRGRWFRWLVAGVALGCIGYLANRSDAATLPGEAGAVVAPDASAPPDVLVINSYAPGYRWSDDELQGLLSVLRERYPEIEPVIQYLDFKRFIDPVRETWLIQDLAGKCRVRPPRLIITLDDAAFDFAKKNRGQLGGPEVPLVFGGLNLFTPVRIAGQRNVTGVSEESDFSGTFELIRSLKPDTRRVLVISNPSDSGRASRRSFEGHVAAYAARYQFEFYDQWTSDELIERVAALPDGTVGLILDVTRDVTGKNNYNSSAFTEALAARARVPVFITSRPPGNVDWSIHPWDGLGGGLVVAEVHGAAVGRLALRVLAGEQAEAIPVVEHSPQRLEVEFNHMRRFGFSLDLLPPGTRVTNAPTTFYQINRPRLVAIGGAFLVLCAVIVVLSVNILRRRRAEQALRRAEEQLRSSQKMEAIGLLAGGVAHDFNNILQIIRGHAGFLQDDLGDLPAHREDLEIIQGATERAAQLTRQLLVLGQRQTLNTSALDPNVLVGEMAKMLRRVLGEHIEVRVSLPSEPCTLVADKGQLEQVLLNLCLNARDAMPGGGRILIELTRVELEANDCAGQPQLKPGPHLRLTVSDSGAGMPREVLDRLFEPFFTTKAPGKGTGLGLAVVYGIVRQHGGSITVYSEVGAGTSFKILLPLGTATTAEAAAGAKGDVPRGAGSVLLAEDDPQVRQIGIRLLEQNGFTVLVAQDGAEAEALLARHHAVLRLAILDVLMPKRNGRQVQEYLQAHHPGVPVLFCSGYTAEMLPPGAVPDSGYALLNKPYSGRDLLVQVHRLMRVA